MALLDIWLTKANFAEPRQLLPLCGRKAHQWTDVQALLRRVLKTNAPGDRVLDEGLPGHADIMIADQALHTHKDPRNGQYSSEGRHCSQRIEGDQAHASLTFF